MTLPRHLRHGGPADTSMAARHPAPPDDADPPVSRPYAPSPRPAAPWNGQWTSRPPSTLAEEVAAAQRAHEAWVRGFPDQGLPADADVDVAPWTQP